MTATVGTGLMRAALVHEFTTSINGNLDSITVSSSVPRPVLCKKAKSKEMIVRVLACSLSPGDIFMLSGRIIVMHPKKFPYVPGMDVCGIVEEVSSSVEEKEFKKGDIIVANNGINPTGGLAEYMRVKTSNATRKPEHVNPVDAAAASSAMTALHAAQYVNTGDRVLILGGSGGVGTAAIQLVKQRGASFVATTSTQTELCTNLGADKVIDYRTQNWWDIQDFKTDKFDKIIDAVGGKVFQHSHNVLKMGNEGGYYIAVQNDDPNPDMSSWLKVFRFFAKLSIRPIYTWLCKRSNPIYVVLLPFDEMNGLREVLNLVNEGKLKVQQDPSSPFQFTEEGVRSAFRKLGSSHAHGKCTVVISE
jgi:NADPH:quinone reductase-like Zn-dependent oxidoreductase